MSPNRTSAKLSTERDAAAERAIIDEWYGPDVYVKRLATYSSADYLVGTLESDYLVECKDRSRYHQSLMARDGYLIGVDKLERIVAQARRREAIPTLLVRVRVRWDDKSRTAIIRMDPLEIIERSDRRRFQRERGRETRRDVAEMCFVVMPELWQEWRSPTYRWIARCATCDRRPDGRFPDGSPSFRCSHPPVTA